MKKEENKKEECKHVLQVEDNDGGLPHCSKCHKTLTVNWKNNTGASGFGK